MADGQAMASKFVDHGATSPFVGIDDHHRTLHTGSTVLQREVDRSHGSMAAALQGRRWQRRTLALIRADLARAASWQIDPEPSTSWPCALAGRHPRLVIKLRDGSPPVVYGTGEALSLIHI